MREWNGLVGSLNGRLVLVVGGVYLHGRDLRIFEKVENLGRFPEVLEIILPKVLESESSYGWTVFNDVSAPFFRSVAEATGRVQGRVDLGPVVHEKAMSEEMPDKYARVFAGIPKEIAGSGRVRRREENLGLFAVRMFRPFSCPCFEGKLFGDGLDLGSGHGEPRARALNHLP